MSNLDRTCNLAFDVFMVSFCVIDAVVILSSIAILYEFIKRFKSKHVDNMNKPIKSLFYIGLVFIISVVFSQIFMFAIVAGGCKQIEEMQDHQRVFSALWGFFYLFQSYLLSLITFMTLRYSFNDTPFALSQRTINIYKTIYFIIPIIVIFSIIVDKTTFGAVLTALLILFLTLFFLSIIILFIRKLMAIYKHIDSDQGLITKITKLTVLSGISISLTLLIPLIILCVLFTDPLYAIGSAVFMYGVLIDTTTNLWCIIFTFSYFNANYLKLCGCIHSKCLVVWAKCLGQQERLLMLFNDETDITKTNENTMELSIDDTATNNEPPSPSTPPTPEN